ncbi:unnamed protein product [Phytophthora fragariaefolia]|uniref:Unnamed protein product n=1 Tax=Phytophthora fragariaefolia TaxID=1490495 RepID=A0A9W6YGG8_9STRA|nr:unnamed protein product [Phytophthora fragariaefolia]
MELTWSKAGDMLTIGQQKYTATVVKRFASSDDKSRPRTPMDSNFQHQVADDMQTIGESIRPAVGSLLYASTVSRPDLTTAVRLIAQETEQPTRTVQAAIGRVLGYLARTADMGMVYRRSTKRELQLEVYCDAVFACERERKSSTGFVVFLNGCCISWGQRNSRLSRCRLPNRSMWFWHTELRGALDSNSYCSSWDLTSARCWSMRATRLLCSGATHPGNLHISATCTNGYIQVGHMQCGHHA